MKDSNEKNVDEMCHKEKAGYWRGKYETLKEKTHNGGERVLSVWQIAKEKAIGNLITSFMVGFLILGSGAGAYFYFIKPTVVKAEEFMDESAKKVDNFKNLTIFHPSRWFGSDDNDSNETITSVKTEINETSDENEPSLYSRIFSSDKKESESNVSNIAEKIVEVEIIKSTEKIEIEVTKIEDNRTITQKVKGKWSSWFSKKKENNESKE